MLQYSECRVYVDHLLAEHRRLHRMLREARIAVRAGDPGEKSIDHIVQVLRNVRQELQQHFAEEEAGGCLEEAVSFCPRLSGELRRIEAEHPEMLNEIDRLIAQALDSEPTVDSRLALENAFDELCHQLHAHEAAENELLRQGFGTNVNGHE
jgi:hemerythrin